MARLQDHERISRFLFGKPQTELHLLIDRGWSDGDFAGHLIRHSPIFGIIMGMRYGPEGSLAHLTHVIADISPLQLKDIIGHVKSFGRGLTMGG